MGNVTIKASDEPAIGFESYEVTFQEQLSPARIPLYRKGVDLRKSSRVFANTREDNGGIKSVARQTYGIPALTRDGITEHGFAEANVDYAAAANLVFFAPQELGVIKQQVIFEIAVINDRSNPVL